MNKVDRDIFIEKFSRSLNRQLNMAKSIGFYKEILVKQGSLYLFSVDLKKFFYYIPDNITEILSVDELNVMQEMGITVFGTLGITIENLIVVGGRGLKTCKGLFAGGEIKKLDFSAFDTSNLKTMEYMFVESNIKILKMGTLDISNVDNLNFLLAGACIGTVDFDDFDTSHIKGINSMFYNAVIDTLNITFNTDSVIDMSYLFSSASISNLNMKQLSTKNCEIMKGMFLHFYGFSGVDLSNFDTSKVRDMSEMFGYFEHYASAFDKDLSLEHFNTSNVEDMNRMFEGVELNYVLDLTSFDMSNVKNVERMFYGANVTGLDLGKFDLVTNKVNAMFEYLDFRESTYMEDCFDCDNSKVVNLFRVQTVQTIDDVV